MYPGLYKYRLHAGCGDTLVGTHGLFLHLGTACLALLWLESSNGIIPVGTSFVVDCYARIGDRRVKV